MVRLKGVLHDQTLAAIEAARQTVSELFGEEQEAVEEPHSYNTFRLESISPKLIVIPDTEEIEETDVRYPLLKPFADAHIYWDHDEEHLFYEIEEPSLTDREAHVFDEIKDALEEKITVSLADLETTQATIDYLAEQIDQILIELGYALREEERNKILYYVYRNFAGLSDIEALMHDPYIEDIGCAGLDIPVYVVHSKFGSIKTDLVFEDEEELKNLVVKLAERSGKYVSYAEPLLDGTLPDGSRVNASLTRDVTTKGPTFSIRKFQEVPFSAIDLVELGSANLDIMAYMWMALQYQKSMLIIGGTATGKTTFLNSVVTFIPPEHKIVSIEDTRELQLPHENWIPAVTRSGTGLGNKAGEISMYQLLRESFRQNPDYVIVGEVRGEEASVLFQGMASGHPSISTMHASNPHDVVSRLTTPPINLSPALVNTLDLVVSVTHAMEAGKNQRRVKSIYEIEDVSASGAVRSNEYVSWNAMDDTFTLKGDSNVLSNIQQQFGMSHQQVQEELENRKTVLRWLQKNGYTHFEDVSRVISEYYADKDRVLTAITENEVTRIQDLLQDTRSTQKRQSPREFEELPEELQQDVEQWFDVEGENPFE